MNIDEKIAEYKADIEKCERVCAVTAIGSIRNAAMRTAEDCREMVEWLEELKQLREQASNLEEPNKWIPTSERLPEEDTAVLIWCPERKNIYCAYLEEKQWWIFGAYFEKVTFEVVAWMPLPLPYKAESEE